MGVTVQDAPPAVRLAGAAVTLGGVAVLVGGVALVAAAAPFAVWGFFALLGLGVGAVGVTLGLGHRGARGPAVVVALLALGVAFYAAVPSGRPEWGVPGALVAAAVLAALLSGPARAWAAG